MPLLPRAVVDTSSVLRETVWTKTLLRKLLQAWLWFDSTNVDSFRDMWRQL